MSSDESARDSAQQSVTVGPGPAMILIIDNYDSFTYNLVQRLGEIDPGVDLRVCRNDRITLAEINEGFANMKSGRVLRSVIMFDA